VKISELLARTLELSTPYVFLFDIDGTLLSSGGAGKMALEQALLSEFNLDGIRTNVPYSGRTDVAIGRELLHVHGIEPNEDRLRQLQEAYLQRLPAALAANKGMILPGVLSLLNELQQSSTPVLIGLLTGNIRRGATVKLGHYNINHYFRFGGFGDGVLTRDEVARAAWTEAQQHHPEALSGKRTWVIGDTPLDITCARHIGAKVLAVATGQHPIQELESYQPDVLLPSLEQEGLMERLLQISQ
jgi:phosphoglycolate phosphatase